MARFVGTEEDFQFLIGPKVRNLVHYICRHDKAKRNGKCDECGSKKQLEAAHKQRGRKDIVSAVLSRSINQDGLIECDIKEVLKKIEEEHLPIEENFRFLCRDCHREYDNKPKAQASTNSGKQGVRKKAEKLENMEFKKLHKIALWSKRPQNGNHQVVKAYIQNSPKNMGLDEEDFIEALAVLNVYEGSAAKIKSNLGQMFKDTPQSHGRIFYREDNKLVMYPQVFEEVKRYFSV